MFKSSFCLPILTFLALVPYTFATPTAVEIGPEDVAMLPQGREADGIVGDFLLRNDLVEAVVSGNQPDRRPNMSNYYGADGMTPGCLYDLGIRGQANDNLTIFCPAGQKGRISWVRVTHEGNEAAGIAEVECHISPAQNKGLAVTHRYRLKDGWQGLEIETIWKNTTAADLSFPADDVRKSFGKTGEVDGLFWGDAIDPADKIAYAAGRGVDNVKLKPGEEKSLVRFVSIGTSPVDALSKQWERQGETSPVSIEMLGPDGKPNTSVHAVLSLGGGKTAFLYPDAQGRAKIRLKGGTHELSFEETGRATVKEKVTVTFGQESQLTVKLGPQAGVAFAIRGADNASLPCKAMFRPLDPDAKKLDLGPNNRAHGCVDQWHSETGNFFVPLEPGKYEVTVAHGMEYSVLRQVLTVAPGQASACTGVLTRQVDSTGWISADFHNHTTQSGDNTCGVADRLINLAAEHIEFAPTTEHNRLYDWAPHLKRMGLDKAVATVPGMELTGSVEHLNAFPFFPEPGKQDNGAPKYNLDARIDAITLRHWQKGDPDRYIQVNHPQLTRVFHDRDWDGIVDDGFVGIGQYVDLWETENTMDDGILQTAPFRIFKDTVKLGTRKARWNGEFLWLQLLNQGHRLRGIAAADAHTVYGNGVGGWRNFYPSSSDEPEKINWREITQGAKAGAGMLTNGPFLEAWTPDGKRAGGGEMSLPGGHLSLRVKVQCAEWVEVDRVLLLINGRTSPETTWTRASHPQMFQNGPGAVIFDQTIQAQLKQDAHVIVVAYGLGKNLEKGFGTSPQHRLQPCAYLNPIWLDTDGGGFAANHDDLGWPWTLVKGDITVPKALKIFQERGMTGEEIGQPLTK